MFPRDVSLREKWSNQSNLFFAGYCGMYFMMQFVMEMGNNLFDIGSFWLCCLSCHGILTMQNKAINLLFQYISLSLFKT